MTVTQDTVAVCMAVYNGESYIEEQIDSILRQSCTDWILFIRDDGSDDDTAQIAERKACEHPGKIVIIKDSDISGGSSCRNFMSILKWVSARYDFGYFMFSDQDDVWLENKIEVCLKTIKKAEGQQNRPILVHTDLKVVDGNLNVIGESFFEYRSLDITKKDLRHLLVQNNVTGCTAMWNRQLNDLLDKEGRDVIMHDWWISLTASAMGQIICIEQPTILYRQHGGNVLGAVKVNSVSFILNRLKGSAKVRKTLRDSFVQAESFLDSYRENLSEEQICILSAYAGLARKGKLGRIITVMRESFLKQGIINIIGEIVFI